MSNLPKITIKRLSLWMWIQKTKHPSEQLEWFQTERTFKDENLSNEKWSFRYRSRCCDQIEVIEELKLSPEKGAWTTSKLINDKICKLPK